MGLLYASMMLHRFSQYKKLLLMHILLYWAGPWLTEHILLSMSFILHAHASQIIIAAELVELFA